MWNPICVESHIYFHILHATWYAQPFNYLMTNFSLATGYLVTILQLYSVCLRGNPLEDKKAHAKKLWPW